MKTARAYTSPVLTEANEIVPIQLQPFRNIYVHKAPGTVYLKTPAGYFVPICQPQGIESPEIIEGGVFEAYCDAAGPFTLITTLIERITGGATEGVKSTVSPPGAARVMGRDPYGTHYSSWATQSPNPLLAGLDYQGDLGVFKRHDSRNLDAAPCNVPFYPSEAGLLAGYTVPEQSGAQYMTLDFTVAPNGYVDVWGALSSSGSYVWLGRKDTQGLTTFNIRGYNVVLLTPSAPDFNITGGLCYGTIFW